MEVENQVMTNDIVQGGNGRAFQNLVMLSARGIPKLLTFELSSDEEKPNQHKQISKHSFLFPILIQIPEFLLAFISFRFSGS